MKYETKVSHYVNYKELEREVKRLLGFNWSIVAAETLDNDSSWTYAADGDILADDAKTIEEAIENGGEPQYGLSAGNILDWMVQQGYIPAGNYVIEVCW